VQGDISALALKLLESVVRLGETRETGSVGDEDAWEGAGLTSADYDNKYFPQLRSWSIKGMHRRIEWTNTPT
jgi:hypothetical protein